MVTRTGFWLVGEWYGRELILVVGISFVFHIFEDWVKRFHALGIEEADVGDETLKS